MNTSTKILLSAAFVGTLGLGGLVRTVYANPSKPAVAITPQHSVSTQNTEVSDGDGEANDATEAPEQAKQPKTQAVTTSGRHPDENEANESPNDSDGGANEDAH